MDWNIDSVPLEAINDRTILNLILAYIFSTLILRIDHCWCILAHLTIVLTLLAFGRTSNWCEWLLYDRALLFHDFIFLNAKDVVKILIVKCFTTGIFIFIEKHTILALLEVSRNTLIVDMRFYVFILIFFIDLILLERLWFSFTWDFLVDLDNSFNKRILVLRREKYFCLTGFKDFEGLLNAFVFIWILGGRIGRACLTLILHF